VNGPTIIVCIKDVPDPEGPSSAYEIHSESKKVVPVGIPPVINPYDENALELAVRLKERWGGTVIAINMSEKAVTPVLKKALGVGADRLILAEDHGFKDLSSYATAQVLSSVISKIGSFDIVLTGREAADWDSGQVGVLIGELLKIPSMALVKKVELEDGVVTVERLKRNGYEVVRAPIPVVLTVSSEVGELRLATLKAIQDARKKPVVVWRAADLGFEPGILRTKAIRAVVPPPSHARQCLLIEGTTAQEKGENLAVRLRQDNII
jgi:electron transfer flavoprotein beta subunit